MSLVTDMVIITAYDEEDAMTRVNHWCVENDIHRRQVFNKMEPDQAGGTKFFGGDVWAMAANYFPHEELAVAFHTFGWQSPDSTVLVINHENDDETRVVRP